MLRAVCDPHFNVMGSAGATVLILPKHKEATASFGRVRDPDLLVRLAERDPIEAAACLEEQLERLDPASEHWPDILARRLRSGWHGSLAEWADRVGCRPETVSRTFARVYG